MRIDDVEIVSAVVCDDVRKEDNGKEILIGVYGGNITVSRLPSLIAPTFWLQLTPEKAGTIPMNFRFINDSDVVFLEGKGFLEVKVPGELTSLSINGPPIQAQGDLKLLFQLQFGDSEWTTVRAIEVRKLQ